MDKLEALILSRIFKRKNHVYFHYDLVNKYSNHNFQNL